MIVGAQNEEARNPLPAGAVRVLPASSGQWSRGSGERRSGGSVGGREGEAYAGEGKRESDDASPWDRYDSISIHFPICTMINVVYNNVYIVLNGTIKLNVIKRTPYLPVLEHVVLHTCIIGK